jgi:hypothetical protein
MPAMGNDGVSACTAARFTPPGDSSALATHAAQGADEVRLHAIEKQILQQRLADSRHQRQGAVSRHAATDCECNGNSQ